jgi:DNA-directed RNA polymerase subunit beta'
LIPAGTGFAYHQNRARTRHRGGKNIVVEPSRSAETAEQALTDALNMNLSGKDE